MRGGMIYLLSNSHVYCIRYQPELEVVWFIALVDLEVSKMRKTKVSNCLFIDSHLSLSLFLTFYRAVF